MDAELHLHRFLWNFMLGFINVIELGRHSTGLFLGKFMASLADGLDFRISTSSFNGYNAERLNAEF